MVTLKHLNNFWRTNEMPLINCEINFILTWSTNCFILDNPLDNQITKLELHVSFIRNSIFEVNVRVA